MADELQWARVQALEGKALTTVRDHAFRVSDVSANHVTVVPLRTGRARQVVKSEIEAAFALGREKWRPLRIREAGASEYNPAYVAAILLAAVE